jgi:uncharacterized UPF0160 family protein
MELVGGEFVAALRGLFDSWLPARSIVEDAIEERFSVDPSGEIIILKRFCPWQEHLFDVEPQFISGSFQKGKEKEKECFNVFYFLAFFSFELPNNPEA